MWAVSILAFRLIETVGGWTKKTPQFDPSGTWELGKCFTIHYLEQLNNTKKTAKQSNNIY